jgi:hypothetical protein
MWGNLSQDWDGSCLDDFLQNLRTAAEKMKKPRLEYTWANYWYYMVLTVAYDAVIFDNTHKLSFLTGLYLMLRLFRDLNRI